MFTLDIFWNPSPTMIINALDRFKGSLRSWRVPFERSIRQVMAPSFQKNFDVGGRPPWAPLEAPTVDIRGSATPILVRSGALKAAAGQMNIWTIDGPGGEAYIAMEQLPRHVFYGIFHQEGTRVMTDRPWAVIQEEDADAIAEVFADYLEERGVDAGLRVRSR